MTHPPLLIESWLPIAAIGAESQRENSTGQHPPPNRLHVWWARRPLIASRAAILAGVLPAWSAAWPADLRERFPTEHAYHQWFARFMGIHGDPVASAKLIKMANDKGIKLKGSPYGYPRAFTVNPSAEDLAIMGELLDYTWGTGDLSVLDPFAGGGSIPLEALRYGFTTVANDLNPVAAVILKATLDYPARFGPELADDIRRWGDIWAARVKEKLALYFPKQPGESIFAFLWARTVTCPTTGKPVPLSPNWRLSKDLEVAARLIADEGMAEPRFEIVTGAAAKAANPDVGTISRGVARSPWTGETISGDYIKAEAQAGRMGQMLYAVATKGPGGFKFRPPTAEDLAAVSRAETAVEEKRQEWVTENVIPTEGFPEGNDNRPLIYGMPTWSDFFSPRQLLAMGEISVSREAILRALREQLPADKARAVEVYTGLVMDKVAIYNNRNCRFDPSRGIRSIFDRHDYAFVSSHAEFDASANLLPWVIDQVVDSYSQMAELLSPSQVAFGKGVTAKAVERLQVKCGTANSLYDIPDGSVHNITVDPPYYDNVQYAELSDFFYVWLKRSIGHLFPDFFRDELTNKDDEAVANPARFASLGSKKQELAKADYERKMAAAFREMHRVLRDDGCLTVMFTHKQVAAWDTLASALIGAGFTVKASWPVHTESEHSLHQAQKNAASSTILLVCRKRAGERGSRGAEERRSVSPLPPSPPAPMWWDDLQPRVREEARKKATEFAAQGIRGVDLYISVFGPTLSIISEQWPVLTSEVDPKTGQPRTLRPETALDLAREEVVRLRKEGLLRGRLPSPVATGEGPGVRADFDPVTDWYLMAWDAFGAEQFPYDEARKLAIALGVDLDKTIMAGKRLAAKKGEFIVMQTPVQRRKKGMVDDEVMRFESWIDAMHTAMMVYAEDGAGACDVFLRKTGLKTDGTFKALLQTLLNAVPRARVKGKFVRPEAEALENMRLAFFDELAAPAEEEPALPGYVQMGLAQLAEESAPYAASEGDEETDDS